MKHDPHRADRAPWDPIAGADLARPMYDLVRRLFPICRSITGEGVRDTLRIVGELIPLTVHEVASGTRAFDWTVPREWNIRDAYIANAHGDRVVDFRCNNLHVVSYSTPVRRTMPLGELQRHLHSLPDQPDLIPYRTSYYEETWGFCLSHHQRQSLPDGDYEVVIDSTLADGSLTYGECLLPGASNDEVLIYTHTCHPSLANDNLSGIAVCTFLARQLMSARRRYSYRFVFAPGTIGSLVWLSRHADRVSRVRHGLVAVLLGDSGSLRYKRSRIGNAEVDRVVQHALKRSGATYDVEAFSPYGYDERQFGSPGFNLPVGRLSRSPNSGYPEYHTSADNLALIRPESLADSLSVCVQIVEILEGNRRFLNTSPFGEPQLGRRGLYRPMGGVSVPERETAMLWTLNRSDGAHSLLDIADEAGLDFELIRRTADELLDAGLLTTAS
jgi:aminopeptidase-like protein